MSSLRALLLHVGFGPGSDDILSASYFVAARALLPLRPKIMNGGFLVRYWKQIQIPSRLDSIHRRRSHGPRGITSPRQHESFSRGIAL